MNQIQDYLVRRSIPLDLESGMDSPLYGAGALDSMQLVDFIMFVEDAYWLDYGQRLLLANAAAFSAKRSPYRTLGSFAEFLEIQAQIQAQDGTPNHA